MLPLVIVAADHFHAYVHAYTLTSTRTGMPACTHAHIHTDICAAHFVPACLPACLGASTKRQLAGVRAPGEGAMYRSVKRAVVDRLRLFAGPFPPLAVAAKVIVAFFADCLAWLLAPPRPSFNRTVAFFRRDGLVVVDTVVVVEFESAVAVVVAAALTASSEGLADKGARRRSDNTDTVSYTHLTLPTIYSV